ncbi:Leucine carboxyl methyltransferase 2 [Wickerhamomyces ciferrii]|uniref:Leucine carboxyl methyltransferase 1 n=1 Tax=Wickerhamomyces ciferrii (strain ATCC 14091 / BCRC 22168 / CBS 111 / JCM 3599 / NBRC 0793 / NRRL Y-1031 F-60-10) TaxID=1206466 RepID=K0KHJ1_WICCF|nr:Leucine carboxyl methyltransferase 2 [Wickerhamomyces ciferrii]CCH40819.1 Leucine carboxyl methyltransferase 2 [Wickerhamomyces ciferrii]
MDRNTKVIRSTDYDALSCRISAHKKQYIQDEYLQHIIHGFEKFLKYEYKLSSRRILNSIINSVKLPIINRGTYIRTRSIDLIIEKFLEKFESDDVQIINLGAGSDTRPFKYLPTNEQISWVEFDFKDSTKLKNATIVTDPILSKKIGIKPISDIENLDNFYNGLNDSLISDRYKLIAIDLRDIKTLQDILNQFLNKDKPTLIISECMLCYTESLNSTEILQTLKSFFTKTSIVIYDPIGGDDNFGNVMIENLKIRNISMPSLLEFNTLDKYSQRLKDLGFQDVKIDNLNNIMNNWINDDEKRRISKLEFLDELEELNLLLEHYCLILTTCGFDWSEFDLEFTQ